MTSFLQSLAGLHIHNTGTKEKVSRRLGLWASSLNSKQQHKGGKHLTTGQSSRLNPCCSPELFYSSFNLSGNTNSSRWSVIHIFLPGNLDKLKKEVMLNSKFTSHISQRCLKSPLIRINPHALHIKTEETSHAALCSLQATALPLTTTIHKVKTVYTIWHYSEVLLTCNACWFTSSQIKIYL